MSRNGFYNLDRAGVEQAAKQASVVPLVREVPADLVTPVAAFLELAERAPQAFLLESAAGSETTGRWSFLGWEPLLTLRAGRDWLERIDGDGVHRGALDEDALAPLRETLAPYRPATVPGVPPFAGGLVGYLAYDAVRWFERLPARKQPFVGAWYEFALYETVVALDHLKHRVLIVNNLRAARGGLEQEYRRAVERSEQIAGMLMHPRLDRSVSGVTGHVPPPMESVTPKGSFLQGVETIQSHIRAGDIFQGVLSQRFVRATSTPPFSIYRALRRINPSPYLFFVRGSELTLTGSSPETLVRCTGSEIETHPIAGTRPRGVDAAADELLERELRADPKENAEHLMLVDLGRNDLGRVSHSGSVRVDRYADVERYSHVMHLVSRVTGRMREDVDALAALQAAFPAGTVTGAPKIRAMEILDELEPVARGPYAGAVAYLDFAGNLDSCISIRTLVARDGGVEVQAGAGVVADSVPEREYNETRDKARALMEAVARAEQVFG